MSSLAMVLAAGMALGSGPEKVSVEVERRLDLRGNWEGIGWLGEGVGRLGKLGPRVAMVRHDSQGKPGLLLQVEVGSVLAFKGPIIDEGEGRFRMNNLLGIYRVDDDCLVICFAFSGRRPTCFRAGAGQCLVILRRVQSGD